MTSCGGGDPLEKTVREAFVKGDTTQARYNRIVDLLKSNPKKYSDYIRQRPYVADEIIVSTRKEGEEVLDNLGDILREYGQVSVADFYELVGIPSNYTDNKRGWKELRYTGLHKSRYGYTFSLPDPIDL